MLLASVQQGIKHPETIFPSLPSGMDKILKEHFDHFMKKGELPPELQQLNGEVNFFDNEELPLHFIFLLATNNLDEIKQSSPIFA